MERIVEPNRHVGVVARLNELSKQILSGKVSKDAAIVLDCFDKEVIFRNKEREGEVA